VTLPYLKYVKDGLRKIKLINDKDDLAATGLRLKHKELVEEAEEDDKESEESK
jgi:hypothetical protein